MPEQKVLYQIDHACLPLYEMPLTSVTPPHILLIDDDEDEFILLRHALQQGSPLITLSQLTHSDNVPAFLRSLSNCPT